ncbi:Nepenthesin [Bertholletia excelsa]
MVVTTLVVAVLNLSSTTAAAVTAITTINVNSSAYFQELKVQQTIQEIKLIQPVHQLSQPHTTSVGDERKWKLNLLHVDNINSNLSNYLERFKKRMKRDAIRVATLIPQLLPAGDSEEAVEEFGSEVVSGTNQGIPIGEYLVRIGVGSPPRSQYMVIDSGSDIIWVQCQPCNLCYNQSDPVFDPQSSASFSGIPCTSSVCDRLLQTSSSYAACHGGGCTYQVSYQDGSYTKGTLAFETLSFPNATVRNVAIGCGHSNQGLFIGVSGLLGLGAGSMSFVGQLGGQTGGAFSYCLVSRGSTGSTGSLEFGREALPVGAAWVPLLRNPAAPSFYYVGLEGLGVGGTRLPIPGSLFGLKETGEGGVVMDTGTPVTRFPAAAYKAFRDAFRRETASLPMMTGGVSIFDTCYDLRGYVSVRVPTVSFYFTGGTVLTLPARNFMIPVDEEGRFCFAFAGSEGEVSIIGNIQQEGIQISFDAANSFVGFGPNIC